MTMPMYTNHSLDCPNCQTGFFVSVDDCETCGGSGERPECGGVGQAKRESWFVGSVERDRE